MFDTLTLFLEYAFPFCLQMPSLQNENNFWHLQSWNGRRHAQKLEWKEKRSKYQTEHYGSSRNNITYRMCKIRIPIVLRLHEVTVKVKVKVVK